MCTSLPGPARIVFLSLQHLPVCCSSAAQREVLKCQGSVKEGGKQGRGSTQCAISRGEGKDKLIGIGHCRAPLKMSGRQVAPQRRVLGGKLSGFGELSNGAVGVSGHQGDEGVVP